MDIKDSTVAARDQLNRVLTFFPRVDGKASVVFAIDTSLLAFLTTKLSPLPTGWKVVPIGLTFLCLAISYWYLYRQAFPSLAGGERSLLYFREIAGQTEATYHSSWKTLTDESYVNDLLGQIWRNSQILRQKFDHLKVAMRFLALAIVPWTVALIALTWKLTP